MSLRVFRDAKSDYSLILVSLCASTAIQVTGKKKKTKLREIKGDPSLA